MKLPPETVIEVVMRKEMTIADYMKLRENVIKKGWRCQGYQKGFYQNKTI